MKPLFKTAPLAGALALGASLFASTPATAQMPCTSWEVTGSWAAEQANGYRVEFNLSRARSSATVLSGTASYEWGGHSAVLFSRWTTFGTNETGTVQGLIAGSTIQLSTSWGAAYLGQIDGAGRIHGTTYGPTGASSSWTSDRPMSCKPVAAPPPFSALPPPVPAHGIEPSDAGKGLTGRPSSGVIARPAGLLDPGVAPSTGYGQPKAGGGSIGSIFSVSDATRPAAGSTPPTPAPPPTPSVRGGCKEGYVWRKANLSDRVCVTPKSAARVAKENSTRKQRVQPGGGAWGPNTCRNGFVWREAFPADLVCVTPAIRALVAEENRVGPSLRGR
jgi:hypothetical protein